MKYVFSLAFILMCITLNAQDRYLTPAEFPTEITKYIQTHFPESLIVAIKKEKEITGSEYEVKLNTLEEVKFSASFQVIKLESETVLPSSVIPEKISNYISTAFPHSSIQQWKMKRIYQKIELDNDIELLFDKAGNFVRIDD